MKGIKPIKWLKYRKYFTFNQYLGYTVDMTQNHYFFNSKTDRSILQVEVKPYVLDDQLCDECQGARCGGKFAPFFCANVTCLQVRTMHKFSGPLMYLKAHSH